MRLFGFKIHFFLFSCSCLFLRFGKRRNRIKKSKKEQKMEKKRYMVLKAIFKQEMKKYVVLSTSGLNRFLVMNPDTLFAQIIDIYKVFKYSIDQWSHLPNCKRCQSPDPKHFTNQEWTLLICRL